MRKAVYDNSFHTNLAVGEEGTITYIQSLALLSPLQETNTLSGMANCLCPGGASLLFLPEKKGQLCYLVSFSYCSAELSSIT